MKKQELIHYHALLHRTALEMSNLEEENVELLEDYNDLQISPTSIHKSEASHEEAVWTLLESMVSTIEQEQNQTAELEV